MATRVAVEEKRAEAEPTKDFFISMLVKDIELTRAILDLVDNSVDGARRNAKKGNFRGFLVRIVATAERFEIEDNAGGISQEVAEHYAFRFGRAAGMKTVKHSVGQFGVGMKRALFKLGTGFQVESTDSSGSFSVRVDVNEWKSTKDWFFPLVSSVRNLVDPPGTRIEVSPLHESVSQDFALENFQKKLKTDLEDAHSIGIQKGLAIWINGAKLEARKPTLLRSAAIQPAYREFQHPKTGRGSVRVRLYAGVSSASDSRADPREAGWYVYCNERLVLGHDQTSMSVWGVSSIPKYHNQYAKFRGYAFFDCDDASRLPWNTTKTGVDIESPVFRHVQQSMIILTRPVIDFLNDVDAEKKLDQSARKLTAAFGNAKPVLLARLKPVEVFKCPAPGERERTETKISYSRSTEKVRTLQKQMGAKSSKEVGERTFDYYFRFEISGK